MRPLRRRLAHWRKRKFIIVQANIFNGNKELPKARKQLARTKAHIISTNESSKLRYISDDYERYGADEGSHGKREINIFVRKDIKVNKFDLLKMTEDMNTGVAHDRWCGVLDYEFFNRDLTHLCTHVNAAIYDFNNQTLKNSPGAKMAHQHMNLVNVLVNARLEYQVRDVTVGADFNYPINNTKWRLSPANVANRNDMRLRGDHIDGIMAPKRWKLIRQRISRLAGADHPMIKHVYRLP